MGRRTPNVESRKLLASIRATGLPKRQPLQYYPQRDGETEFVKKGEKSIKGALLPVKRELISWLAEARRHLKV